MEKALFIEGDVRLFGFLFLPEARIRKAIGFVVIHPFAEEKKSSHRTLVELSRELYKKGFPVLMFDLRGCGDSEGDFVSVRLSEWLADIDRAMHVLKIHTQLLKVGIIGLRLGACLSLCYHSQQFDISEFIWIEPVLKPLDYLRKSLRHKLMKELCTDGRITSNRDNLLQDLQHNISIDFDGYEIGSGFYQDLAEEQERETIAKKSEHIRKGLVISISMNGKETKAVQEIRAIRPELNYDIVQMELFWNKVEEVDNEKLILTVCNYLTRNYT
jgi:predicted alpha/beta-fold hydrolase